MTVQTYAVIDSGGNVVNMIIADGNFEAPSGTTLVAVGSSGAQIGWTYSGSAFVAPTVIPPTQQQIQALLVGKARTALSDSDGTIIRCYSAGVPVPTVWQTYRSALRAIVNGSDTTSTSLPAMPAYPSGT